MENIIVILIISAIISCAAIYVYRQKKQGNTCIGCPHAGKCPGKCGK